MVIKVDLTKYYDIISWLYLISILIYLGFCHGFVVWVMNFITYVFVSILTNGETSPFFRPSWGVTQGCPLSPILFVLTAKWMNRVLKEEPYNNNFKGIFIGPACNTTHLLYMDDILILFEGSIRIVEKFKNILDLLCKVIGMIINLDKSNLSMWDISK